MEQAAKKDEAPKVGATRVRSPMFPFISVARAIERAREFHAQEKRNAARIPTAARHWGYKEKSSGVLQTLAALKQYGLLEDEGTAGDRRIKLTDLARRIILDERAESPERMEAIRTAALKPKIHRDLWDKWGMELPSDDTFRTYLKLDLSFNEASADAFMRTYKETIDFAKLGESDSMSAGKSDTESVPEDDMEPQTAPFTGKPPLPPASQVARQGELERLRFNLSGDRTVRLVFSGPVPTQAEIDELMEYLKVSRRTFPPTE